MFVFYSHVLPVDWSQRLSIDYDMNDISIRPVRTGQIYQPMISTTARVYGTGAGAYHLLRTATPLMLTSCSFSGFLVKACTVRVRKRRSIICIPVQWLTARSRLGGMEWTWCSIGRGHSQVNLSGLRAYSHRPRRQSRLQSDSDQGIRDKLAQGRTFFFRETSLSQLGLKLDRADQNSRRCCGHRVNRGTLSVTLTPSIFLLS